MTTIESEISAASDLLHAVDPAISLSPGIHRGIPAEQYHSIKAVSASFLKRFIFETPAHAKAMWDGRMKEDTSAMSKGTALHAALLEPDVFASAYRVGPEVNRNTREWKAFAAQCDADDVTPLKPSESDDIIGMRESIWADAYCAKAIHRCDDRELTLIWTEPDTGLTCKARIDLYSTSAKALLDVKTTGDITRFDKTAYDQGYDVQLAMYARGLAAVGMAATSCGFLVVEQSVPYLPEVFTPNTESLMKAMSLIEEALPYVAYCFGLGEWPGYRTKGNKSARPLDVPAYRRPTIFDRGVFNV